MKVYLISPIGKSTPLLFGTFNFERTEDINEADVVFFDYYSGLGSYNYDEINRVAAAKKKVSVFDATDFGAMSKEAWFMNQEGTHDTLGQSFIRNASHYNNLIYFMRKMDKTVTYPSWVYPYELLMYDTHKFEPTTKEELYSRYYDFCFIGNTSPTRSNLITGLMKYGCFKIDCEFNHTERIPHEEWLNRHRKAKFFISACGGGFSDERKFQLTTIAPMLRNKSNHLVLNDFIDKEDCIEVKEHPDEYDIQKILSVLNDADKLYNIYIKGIEKMKAYYNAEYRANYILETLKQNGVCSLA